MKHAIAVTGAKIFDGAMWHEGKALLIEAGRVTAIAELSEIGFDRQKISTEGGLIVPGFIDLQVNGGGGVLFNNQPDADAIDRICKAHAAFGTTALLPTLITDTVEVFRQAAMAGIEAKRRNIAGFLGLHIEGPHLSLAKKGTHDPKLIRPMDENDLKALVSLASELATVLVTIAPESVTKEQVRELVKAGIAVSFGHTNADYATANAYAEAGVSMVTHLFNAMSPLGHREPGLVGLALENSTINCGLIADGFHVDPVAMRIALRAKQGPGHLFLVTDAMSTIGSDEKGFELNGRQVYRRGGRLTLEDGTLAGADIDMLSCVRFMYDRIGLPLEETLRMASTYPAAAIGNTKKGHLKPGSDADFVMLSEDIEIRSTWIAGACVFAAQNQMEVR
jgi:N-acetylglucosamine-6-phosphate deacetylase